MPVRDDHPESGPAVVIAIERGWIPIPIEVERETALPRAPEGS